MKVRKRREENNEKMKMRKRQKIWEKARGVFIKERKGEEKLWVEKRWESE